MNKPFRCGLVVGKFAPLHRGHELVIGRAHQMCDHVVLISYSNPEFPGCEPERRERWLAELFPAATRLVVTPAMADIPPNDAPPRLHREFVGRLCDQLGVQADAVFTSEEYGDGFAADLTAWFRRTSARAPVRHVRVDAARSLVPISGTRIRADVHGHRPWLHPAVYGSFVERVCLLGGESSGKSTLARALAAALGTAFVAEYGRELWEAKNGMLDFGDLRAIAQEQVRREEQAVREANRFLVCDTSPLTTLFYSQAMFSRADPVVAHLAGRRYDYVFLCAPDFAFVQDGTRRTPEFRDRQHTWYLAEFARRNIPFTVLSGDTGSRHDRVRAALDRRAGRLAR